MSERTTPRLVEPDTEENLQRLFLENNWTDKLPIVLPTEERVAEMLAHTSRKPRRDRRPYAADRQSRACWEYTVEKVAVNAVMAGARPEYFPVILALAASRGVGARQHLELGLGDGRGERPDPPRDRHELRHRRDGPLQPRQRHHRPGLWPAVAEPAGRLGARRDLHGLAGQQLHLQQPHLRRERGAQPLGAAPRAEGLQADRQHGEHLLRLPLDHVLPRPAREILARACARHAARHRSPSPRRACCSIRSPRGSSSTAAASTPRRS